LEKVLNYLNTVGARFRLALSGVIIVFGIALTVSIVRLAAFNSTVSEITGPRLADVEITDAWSASVSESMRHARNTLIMDDKAQIQGELAEITALAEKGAEFEQALSGNVQFPEGKALLQQALEARAAVLPLDQQFVNQVTSGDVKAAKDTLLQQARPAQLVLIAALSKLSEYHRTQIHLRAEELAASYRDTRMLSIVLALIAVAIASGLAYRLARRITGPLNQAVAVLGEIEKGNYTSLVEVDSKDEIGKTLMGLKRMQIALKERTEKEHAAATENARIRTALDRVAAGAMLADTEGKITYANDAAIAIFRYQAGEIRKVMPQFDVERLLGSTFDSFGQIPSLQRNVLQNLAAAHTSEARMGDAVFRVTANPVIGSDGKRDGTVVQWIDRTQEAATEQEVQAIVSQALEGDLTGRIREDDKDLFFRTLARGMNRLLENMSEVVRSMAQAAAEVRTGSQEISRGNADLSQRTEEQAASLEETASSMEEMTSTVRNNADNAEQANQLASAARDEAERGGVVVSAAVVAMSEINASSRRIADIIGVIDEIAFQTNLLALNAAVEAARAGDQGRGFAVVASEVRNLASRSAEAAKEIKALIQDSVGKVGEGAKLVDESGHVLREIVTRVKKVTDVMAEIASSSREQASGIEQVNKAITSMDDVTQQNAALVEQASAAARTLTEQASDLTQLIARFKVGAALTTAATTATARRTAPEVAVTSGGPPIERRAPNRPMTGKPTARQNGQPTGKPYNKPNGISKPQPVPARTVLARRPEKEPDEEWKHF
jgi:methyl-accepting chemotaxis protein